MILHTPFTLPPLPQLHSSFSTLPPSSTLTSTLTTSATISESSTRLSDLSGLPPAPPPYGGGGTSLSTELHSGSLRDLSKPMAELLPPGPFSEHAGYIPILPRTSSASGLFRKRCETCSTTHDGSFGAGRFCSSRCARTVGGLAHRKKRLLERGVKARHAAENRNKVKKGRVSKGNRMESPRGVMQIGALLNPTE